MIVVRFPNSAITKRARRSIRLARRIERAREQIGSTKTPAKLHRKALEFLSQYTRERGEDGIPLVWLKE